MAKTSSQRRQTKIIAQHSQRSRLAGVHPSTEDGDRLDVLLTLVKLYEAKRWPIHIEARPTSSFVLQGIGGSVANNLWVSVLT
jgi:hypothetical protein